MTDMPDRIWATNYSGKTDSGPWSDEPFRIGDGGTEYIRADAIRAKPLVWSKSGRQWKSDGDPLFYMITEHDGAFYTNFMYPARAGTSYMPDSHHLTLPAAQAACQAHADEVVRSMLATQKEANDGK